MLIDTNGDGVKEREFAGTHRYNTAVNLAERFAADEGSISNVIIASGESEVDAVTASGLAGNLNAPVLLTRSSRLPHNVARFIDEHNVTDVTIVGGTAAVSDDVATAIESLGSRPNVDRISGADRYATAAAIGGELGGPNPTWCGSDQSAAILVNGGTEGRADAIAIGPMAFRLGLPMLLTAADEVPEATAAFLTDNKVERVVVVGGMGAVSADVVDALVEDIGVVNVQRISGGSAAATSVMVAKEMLGNCAAVLSTNGNMVALVNRDATADGIAAAPVLGRGLGDGGAVPILLVGDELPAAVNDYLASTAEVRGGNKTHLSILAIGGTAVVSGSVMADAIAAAKTSAGLTAAINVKVDPVTKKYEVGAQGGGVFTVTFSDDVDESAAQDPNLYRVNGRRLEAETDSETDNEESISITDLIFTADRTVRVELSHILEPGDTISVVGGGQVAKDANGDLRKLEAASLTLGALASAADRTAPVVEILAVAGRQDFTVFVTEPNPLHNELTDSEWQSYVSVVKGSGNADISATGVTVVAARGETDGIERPGVTQQMTVAVDRVLAAKDVVTVERKAFLDKGGRGNALRRYTVGAHKDQGKFEITSVSIGNNRHDSRASATITSVGTDTDAKMRITATAGGAADGAAGNGWVIYGYDDRPGADDDARAASENAFAIDIGVDMANKVISYTISEVKPVKNIGRVANLQDLASALVSNSDFAANFSVDYVRAADGVTKADPTQIKTTQLGGTDPAGEHFAGGVTSVGVVVRFNDAVESLSPAGSERADLAFDIAGKIDTDLSSAEAGIGALGGAVSETADAVTVNFRPPDNVVHISYSSQSLERLPTRAGFRVIAAGVATSYGQHDVDGTPTDTTNVREILNSLRPDASIKP